MKYVGLFSSDWHICDKKPIARIDEPDWLEAQMRIVNFIVNTANQYNVPIYIIGDVFDNSSKCIPNTFNTFINSLNDAQNGVYACSGNHDQKDHNLNCMMETCYQTAVLSHAFIDHSNCLQSKITMIPFFKSEEDFINICSLEQNQMADIVCLHRYVYDGDELPWMEKSNKADFIKELFPNAKVIFCGDNHLGFYKKYDDETFLINCGTVCRHTSDLISYQPKVYLLVDTELGYKIKAMPIDTSKDLITDRHLVQAKNNAVRSEVVIRTLQNVSDISLSYEETLKKFAKNTICEKYLLTKLEECRNE